jgi:DNA-binding response OmpR family regulator
VKVLVVDDDDELRAVVAFALRQGGFLALEAADPGAALAALEREQPSLIVLDLNLGREDGLALLPGIRARSRAPVLILSVRSSEEDVVGGLDRGADDYLTKPFSPRTLLARVRALLRRSRGEAPPEPVAVGRFRLDLERRQLSVGGRAPVRLTPLELRLVQLLLAHAGEVVANERLLAHVWGARGGGDRQLLKQLVHRLRQKIEDDPADPRLLRNEAGAGYALAVGERAQSS